MEKNPKYETVIGLEVHIQLNTKTKAFSTESNSFGDSPNTNISPVSLALPGALPIPNKAQIMAGCKMGIAIDGHINRISHFDRKNYFYPDLPKGYQITQDDVPVVVGGEITFETGGTHKTIRIHHIHCEEDAGKTIHDLHPSKSMVDYNRAGTPLLEMVTEPDFRSGQEVYDFIAYLQLLVRYLDISDGNMEEGSLRCDVNISVRLHGQNTYGERCEVKNVNSKKFAMQAIDYESKRQMGILDAGGTIVRTTLLFDSSTGKTSPMRSKEDATDYRYFSEPDIPPIVIDDADLQKMRSEVVLLPHAALKMLVSEYHLHPKVAQIIRRDPSWVSYFTSIKLPSDLYPAAGALLVNQFIPYITENNLSLIDIPTTNIEQLVRFLKRNDVNKSSASSILVKHILASPGDKIDIEAIAHKKGLIQNQNQDFLEEIIRQVLDAHPDKVLAYQKGKKGLLGFFMGQAMRLSKGKANAKTMEAKFKISLDKEKS